MLGPGVAITTGGEEKVVPKFTVTQVPGAASIVAGRVTSPESTSRAFAETGTNRKSATRSRPNKGNKLRMSAPRYHS